VFWPSARIIRPRPHPTVKWIVFVKPDHGPKIETAAGETLDRTELWQKDATGKNESLLVKCLDSSEMDQIIAGFWNLQFSTDGKLVYFTTSAWATSPAIHVVDTTTCKERFVIDGWLDRIASTDGGDRLILSRRDYDDIGVFHDIFMVTPAGKLVGPLWLKER
jgi:dipeptidyl aminopeptidase/acylaminoacyl peptidase